jgi:TM2 domain-containing membrane protein YozV
MATSIVCWLFVFIFVSFIISVFGAIGGWIDKHNK